MSLARVSIAALGDVGPDGRVRLVRLAVGSVFEYPRRLCEIEARLTDELPVEAALLEAGRALGAMIAAQLGDRWSTPYKQRVAPALLERGLRSVLGAGA
jgi:CO/xanthine dehydrogenase FAD-binding subunit